MSSYLSEFDVKRILFRISTLEKQYRDEAAKHEPIPQAQFLAMARGLAIAKGEIKEYLRVKYNVRR